MTEHVRFVVVGAGVHGLSTAWHLARRTGNSSDVVVLDKTGVAAGASGVACGIVRNNYFQPAMRELMAHSVAAWESDPEAFSYHSVGYLQVAPEKMRADVERIHAEQQAIGYDSELVVGERECTAYLRDLFADWRAPGIEVVLHEKRGGYANNTAAIRGLAGKARGAGVEIRTGVRVTGIDIDHGAVTAVHTDRGPIGCEQLVVATGPWVRDLWAMLDLPERIDVTGPDGVVHPDHPMWTYLALQEGTLGVDPRTFRTNDGAMPPVVHVDSDQPLHDEDGRLVTDAMWGIYYKPDFAFGGVQGGAAPLPVPRPAADVALDPYGPASPEFTVGADFVRMWTAALAHCHERFAGAGRHYRDVPSGGIGAFTPDSFPVFDTFHGGSAYVIADSNHGFKMLGVGELVAGELLGERSALLSPFRFARYRTGELHPVSNSPFPWS
jgi:glycine/D-amino acid oxidase-like deaminating enzyme